MLVIEDCVVIRKEVEAKYPMVASDSVHELDNALVTLFLEPLVPIDRVWYIVNVELKIRYRLVLLLSTFAYRKSGWRFVAIQFSFEEMIIDFVKISVRYHIQ